jgi:hypothetical protein
MDLFDRVKLLVRSTLSGGLPDISFSQGDPQKMLDTAEAKLDILRDDLARAEKKGNDELAAKLRMEIAGLEKMIVKARGKAQPAQSTPAAQPTATPAVQPAKVESSIDAAKDAAKPAAETPQQSPAPADVVIDETRVADQLKKLREGK